MFDIGMQAGFHPHAHALKLSPRTIRRLADAHATVRVTTYAAMTRTDEKKQYGEWFVVWHAFDGNPSWPELHWRYTILRKAKDKAVRSHVAGMLIEMAGVRDLRADQFMANGPERMRCSGLSSRSCGRSWDLRPNPNQRSQRHATADRSDVPGFN
ncbi:MAG TPA: hypothetical protein VH679_03350 [Vicinamibacterales bacterium]